MNVTPLDLRQHKFRSSVRGFERAEVAAFLAEAADDYEQALRELDKMGDELKRRDEQLADHRERETNLRNTLLTAQKLADDVRHTAKQDAKVIVRDAQSRADVALQNAQVRRDTVEREITQLRLKRTDVETTLEASISALTHALEFVRAQEPATGGDKIRLHRPRPSTDEPLVAVAAT